ncbi:hypothetical protein, partial [Bradyrhizobium sp. UFLA06-06]
DVYKRQLESRSICTNGLAWVLFWPVLFFWLEETEMVFDRVIVATLMPAWPLLDGEEKPAVLTQVVPSVTRAIAGAPFHIRLAVRSVSIFLSLCIFLISAGAGGPLISALRADRFYTLLQRSPGPISSVVRLYRSMTLLAFYEQAPVAAKLLSVRPARNQKA